MKQKCEHNNSRYLSGSMAKDINDSTGVCSWKMEAKRRKEKENAKQSNRGWQKKQRGKMKCCGKQREGKINGNIDKKEIKQNNKKIF